MNERELYETIQDILGENCPDGTDVPNITNKIVKAFSDWMDGQERIDPMDTPNATRSRVARYPL